MLGTGGGAAGAAGAGLPPATAKADRANPPSTLAARRTHGLVCATVAISNTPLSRAPVVRRRRRNFFETTSAFSYGTPGFGVLPCDSGSPALSPFVDAPQSLALLLLSRARAFVRTPFSVVGRLLAIVCDSVPLIGDAISFVGDSLAPGELYLTAREGLIAVIRLSTAPSGIAPTVGKILTDHALP